MQTIHLTATTPAQQAILAYLRENANETLAKKINEGVPVQRDGKTLVCRKTLDGCLKYAANEAKKLARNESCACIDDATVYGWAMHYFEEDSIDGVLQNEDGTEYRTQHTKTTEPPHPAPQPSLFDLLQKDEESPETYEDAEPEPESELEPESEHESKTKPERRRAGTPAPFYAEYLRVQREHPGCTVAYRLGDFYEIFGDDAVTIADELGLTLTSKDCWLPERVPMIGYPYHAADMYEAKIAKTHALVLLENGSVRKYGELVVVPETGEVRGFSHKTDVDPGYAQSLSETLRCPVVYE